MRGHDDVRGRALEAVAGVREERDEAAAPKMKPMTPKIGHQREAAERVLGARRRLVERLGAIRQQRGRETADDEDVAAGERHAQGQRVPLRPVVVAVDRDAAAAGSRSSARSTGERKRGLTLREPGRQRAVERHADHDARHADVAVAGDLQRREHEADRHQDDDDRVAARSRWRTCPGRAGRCRSRRRRRSPRSSRSATRR